MKIARRTMLGLLGASSLTFVWPVWRAAAAPGAAVDARPFFMIFDDVTADTPVEALQALLSPFSALGIPVGFIVKPGDPAQALLAKPAGVSAFLRRFLQQSPALGEIIVWEPDLAQASPYFQMRAARAAKARLAAFLGPDLPQDDLSASFDPLTIAGEDIDGAPKLDALRSAGFRNVLLMSKTSGGTISARCGQTTACMRGNLRYSVSDEGFHILTSVRAAMGRGDMTVLALSLKNIAAIGLDTLRTRGEALADAMSTEALSGRIFAALPKAHVFWFRTGVTRFIGLGVDAPPLGDPVADAGFAAMQVALTAADIPFSVISRNPQSLAGDASRCQRVVWPVIPASGIETCAIAATLPPEAFSTLAEAGVFALVQPAGQSSPGVDQNGLLHLPDMPVSGIGGDGLDPSRDMVLTVSAEAYATDAQRAATVALLRDAVIGSASEILTLPDFAKAVSADGPAFRLMQATRRDMTTVLPIPPLAADQRAALMKDARLAWRYFEKMTDPKTGLCVSTAFVSGVWSSFNQSLTMWDYGSLIQAIIAAHDLGLIDDKHYKDRARALLRGLPAEKIGGLVLPSSEIASNTGKNVTLDYNACDTGRLLIALDKMNRHPLSAGMFTQKVAAWDLARTLRDGQLNSVVQGKFQPFFRSHCAHYAARAFALWGVAAESPYEVRQDGSLTDTRMRLLDEVAQIGAIGAEPLLLEAVDLGFSAPSAYLADVLFTAQARSFSKDGRVISVSEGPMDRAPWFSYQGLKVNADRNVWDVQSIDPAPVYRTDKFVRDAQVISTKAAFLWAAVRPEPYASVLLEYVRKHARTTTIGYSSGVYAATGAAMPNYSDINTNGIILQAIAHRLRNPAPNVSGAP